MQENNFNTTVQSLFKGMDSFISTKTVVGDAVHIGDTIILPLIEVSFGVAAGAFCQDKKNNAAGGLGGKMSPSAVLVIQNGTTKLVNVKNQDSITKILDMVPDLVNKFTSKASEKEKGDKDARDAAAQELAEKLNVPADEKE
ncbi:MAG: GerW family sporulation protein [Lachnospiraceae bacterium]